MNFSIIQKIAVKELLTQLTLKQFREKYPMKWKNGLYSIHTTFHSFNVYYVAIFSPHDSPFHIIIIFDTLYNFKLNWHHYLYVLIKSCKKKKITLSFFSADKTMHMNCVFYQRFFWKYNQEQLVVIKLNTRLE